MDYGKYNNALEKAKVRYNEIKGTDCSEEKFLLDLFPELKESEDERIRKETIPHKFKVGDLVKFDRPSAKLIREILSIDFENERYLTRRTDKGGIKEFIYFCEQDDYVIVGSHAKLSLEYKVNVLADEILALKERVKALEIQMIKDITNWDEGK